MFADTPLHMIEDDGALVALVERLRTRDVIGVDTEADSFHHYQEKLCLVQISDLEADYIVDPLKVEDLSPLKTLLEDPDIVIILHGGDYDVVSLKRDFDIHINNIFDTMIAGQFLGLPKIGLADLIGRYFGHALDKKYQRHDWARRPLEPEHLDYARGDTHWLLALREVMSRRLEQKGRLEAHQEECEWLAKRRWNGRANSDADFHRVKGSNKLDDAALRVLRAVWTYRDSQARSMDRPAFKVLPGDVLIQLAQRRPTDPEALAKVMRPGSGMHRRHAAGLLAAVQEGVADERPLPPVPKKAAASREPLPAASPGAPGVDRLFGPLKDWRNRVVREKSLPPVVVANNTVLRDVAKVAPRTLQDLADIPGMRRWQVAEFGDDILGVIDEVCQGAPPDKSTTPGRRRRRRRRRGSATPA
ncbi:MAG: HRDC domain-containing protein [Myxococcota bacterium]|nr:HRDC domain-containing protein [Myxococcota bacterium]